jgi:chromosome partitioning protein
MRRTLSISNRKGGSGKTTTAVNVSAALAHGGNRVLLIDADPQGHTSISLGISQQDTRLDLVSLLVEKRELTEVMAKTYLDTLMVIPATKRLAAYEKSYTGDPEARTSLAENLNRINGAFDYIVYDTPPTVSLLTVSALIASQEVFIPMQTHFLSLEGLAHMVLLISKIKKLYNPNLTLKGVIPTFYRRRTRLSRSIIDEIKKNLGDDIILHPVRVNISLAEAPSYGKTIFQYKRKSNGASDYLAIAKQIEGLI